MAIEKVLFYNQLKTINDNFAELDGEILSPATAVANLVSSDLPATAATYADLSAARTSVEALRSALETRLDAADSKLNALLTALRTAGIIAT